MSTTAHKIDADDVQHARAAHMRYLFEPWSLRKLEARTGIGRSKLHSKFNGTTEFSIGDIEILAPVIRMTPAQLATELYAITGNEKSAATGTDPDQANLDIVLPTQGLILSIDLF